MEPPGGAFLRNPHKRLNSRFIKELQDVLLFRHLDGHSCQTETGENLIFTCSEEVNLKNLSIR